MFSLNQKTCDYMNIVLTHECNRRCQFCVDQYRGRKEYISKSKVEQALGFAKWEGIKDILLTGGEPTLHPDVVEIAQMVYKHGFRVIMTTNYGRPEVVKQLDGIVDCFNVSVYDQPALPQQSDFVSDLTLHTLIHKLRLGTKQELDEFIDRRGGMGHLKFSTLSPCNEWCVRNQHVEYLDDLDARWVVLFNEMLGQVYRGATIKRYDKVFRNSAKQSLKCHVDGAITYSWTRSDID